MSRLAAKKREEEHLHRLSGFLDEMEGLIHQGKHPTEPDQRFHLVIAEASQNIVLRSLFENILDLMRRPIWLEAKNAVLEDMLITNKYLQQHQAMYGAIRDQNPEEAARYMHKYLMAIYQDQLAIRGGMVLSEK